MSPAGLRSIVHTQYVYFKLSNGVCVLFITTVWVIFYLIQLPGRKDLVLDPALMRPLDRLAGASLLKVSEP